MFDPDDAFEFDPDEELDDSLEDFDDYNFDFGCYAFSYQDEDEWD